MRKVFCFGEILLRMSPALGGEWIRNAQMPVYVGGAELNVATALANWIVPVKYCSAMPANYLSEEIVDEINRRNIDASAMQYGGSRIGTYYLPHGVDLKNAGVIYDRAHSSFAELRPGTIDWKDLLRDCGWFHFSAISPALSQQSADLCLEALEAASGMGLTISVDLNYRSKLWKYGSDPVDVMPQLVAKCSVIMGNIWAAESLLGIPSSIPSSEGKTREELIDAAKKSMLQLHHRYPKATTFAYTFRLENEYWGVIQHGAELSVSKEFAITNVIDKVGSGDCFMAGIIYGLKNQFSVEETINYACSAAVGKLQEVGDATNQTVDQVKQRYVLVS